MRSGRRQQLSSEPSAGYNASLRSHTASVAIRVAHAWTAVHISDIDGSWAAAAPAVVAAITAGQFFGASLAYAFQLELLKRHRLTPDGPKIRPLGFTGFSATGEPLTAPLALAPIRVKQAITRGVTAPQALNAGLAHLTGVAESELQEASRGVMDVALNTEPHYRGYLRHPNPGACGRCLILANRFYRSNEGFLRHPRCSCTHVPVLVGQEMLNLPDARERFDKLSTASQDEAFGQDGAEAIRHGADPASVQNARAGMTKAGEAFTRAGTSPRSVSGRRLAAAGLTRRLSPAGCRIQADGDHDEYLRLLAQQGYVI